MKVKYSLLLLILPFLAFYSCSEDANMQEESVIYLDKTHQNEFDNWIYENLTKPYNIMVKYKWDDSELDNASWVVAPKVEKAKEFVEMFLELWIKPYQEEGGIDFVKEYVPKLLFLCGSPDYNGDGSMTLGFAEGGRKVAIFDINNFAVVDEYQRDAYGKIIIDENGEELRKPEEQILKEKRVSVIESFHTMHHEFGHILHQKQYYPVEFKDITKGKYTGNWQDIAWYEANVTGYITPYSMLNSNEDWVEIIAGLLTNVTNTNEPAVYTVPKINEDSELVYKKDSEGNIIGIEVEEKIMTSWEYKLYNWGIVPVRDNLFVKVDNADVGKELFQQKVDMIIKYYKSNWHMDLYNLQKRIERAVQENIK